MSIYNVDGDDDDDDEGLWRFLKLSYTLVSRQAPGCRDLPSAYHQVMTERLTGKIDGIRSRARVTNPVQTAVQGESRAFPKLMSRTVNPSSSRLRSETLRGFV